MASGKTWVFNPDTGGKKIPDAVKARTEARLRKWADENLAGRFTRLDIRFKGQFCYIDAYTEPTTLFGGPPPGGPETAEEFFERLRNTPTHLCRLRFFGDEERWGFAFYTYSNEKYTLSMFDNGDFFGSPEDAFRLSSVYLE